MKRITHDYYSTPRWAIEGLFKNIPEDIFIRETMRVLDPCCGGNEETDDMHETNPAYISFLREKGFIDVFGIDIREDSKANLVSDFLKTDWSFKEDIIITNPPYSLAQEFVEKSLSCVKEGGYVIMLLRLSFFGSQARKSFWQNNMPRYSLVHAKRIGFTKHLKDKKYSNGTDSSEYMHCIWVKGDRNKSTELRIIYED